MNKIGHPIFSRTCTLRKGIVLMAVPPLLALSVAVGADGAARTPSKESSQKKCEREKMFLLNVADEVNRSFMFASETIDVLTEQIRASAGQKPEIKVDERTGLQKWYKRYAGWLSGISTGIESDIDVYFSGKRPNASWLKLCLELEKGCRTMGGELRGTVRRLEGEHSRTETRMKKMRRAVAEHRLLINKYNLELARELWPRTYRRPYRRRKLVYRQLTEENIFYLQDDLRLLENRQEYYGVLIELGKYEQGWLGIKARDFSKLNAMARAIARDDRKETARATRTAFRAYEADIAVLKKKTAELDAKLNIMSKVGSLDSMERLDELSRYYEMMKSRYERQIEWLNDRIGSHQTGTPEGRVLRVDAGAPEKKRPKSNYPASRPSPPSDSAVDLNALSTP